MTKLIRYFMVGGFLGAGKTTAIARLARRYMERGLKVGLVTNDQARDLVDTYALQAQGFLVGEVPGACFCCNFNQLVATLVELGQAGAPDVIIAEPVGSCTDLVATVIEPLQQLHSRQYEVGPLAVLLKPEHGKKILRNPDKAGFSPKAAYIFLKQLEEADIIAINKIDKLTSAECDELTNLIQQRLPEKQVLAISARRGDGFEELTRLLELPVPQTRCRMEVDYDVYADGEAELGWLNCQLHVTSEDTPFSLDQLVSGVVRALATRLEDAHAETAHIKVLGKFDEQTVSIGNLVAGGAEVELSHKSHREVPRAELIVNARVATSPDQLESIVRRSLETLAESNRLTLDIGAMRCFRPGRPVPTHRMTTDLS